MDFYIEVHGVAFYAIGHYTSELRPSKLRSREAGMVYTRRNTDQPSYPRIPFSIHHYKLNNKLYDSKLLVYL